MRRYPVPVSVPVNVVVRRLSYDAGRCTILGVRHSRKLGCSCCLYSPSCREGGCSRKPSNSYTSSNSYAYNDPITLFVPYLPCKGGINEPTTSGYGKTANCTHQPRTLHLGDPRDSVFLHARATYGGGDLPGDGGLRLRVAPAGHRGPCVPGGGLYFWVRALPGRQLWIFRDAGHWTPLHRRLSRASRGSQGHHAPRLHRHQRQQLLGEPPLHAAGLARGAYRDNSRRVFLRSVLSLAVPRRVPDESVSQVGAHGRSSILRGLATETRADPFKKAPRHPPRKPLRHLLLYHRRSLEPAARSNQVLRANRATTAPHCPRCRLSAPGRKRGQPQRAMKEH